MSALPILLPALLTAFAILGIQAAFGEGMIFGFIPEWVERRFFRKLDRMGEGIIKLESAIKDNPHDEGLKEIRDDLNSRHTMLKENRWLNAGFIPPWWTKPLWGCNVCMSSVWGIAGFAVFHPAPWIYVLAFIPIVAGIMVAYNEMTGE